MDWCEVCELFTDEGNIRCSCDEEFMRDWRPMEHRTRFELSLCYGPANGREITFKHGNDYQEENQSQVLSTAV